MEIKEKINNYNIMIKGKKPFCLGKVKKCRLDTILISLLYYGLPKKLGLPKNIIFINGKAYYAKNDCETLRITIWGRYGIPKEEEGQFKLIDYDEIRALLYYFNVKVNVIMPSYEFKDLKMTEDGELFLYDGWWKENI